MSDSCDLMDCSLPGSSVHGILQERILEWVAIPLSRGSSQPRDQTQVSCIGRQSPALQADSLPIEPLSHQGSLDTLVCIAESLCSTPENNTTLLIKNFNIN